MMKTLEGNIGGSADRRYKVGEGSNTFNKSEKDRGSSSLGVKAIVSRAHDNTQGQETIDEGIQRSGEH